MPESSIEEAREAVAAADAAWSHAAVARDVERCLDFVADDAVMFPPGGPPIVGRSAIGDFMAASLAVLEFSVTWETDHIAVSEGGDLAYAFSRSRFTVPGADGAAIAIDAKAVTVWRRERDGAWRCVADIWNDAPELPAIRPEASTE